MATMKETVKAESETPFNVIRLIKVNNGFLRAYNKSAWKFYTFVKQYQLKRYFVKNINEEIVSLGFGEGMLHSVAEGRHLETTSLGYDLLLNSDEIPGEDSAYDIWFHTIALTERSTNDVDALPVAGADVEKSVIRQIRSFPLERKTPIECQTFLSNIRELLDPQ